MGTARHDLPEFTKGFEETEENVRQRKIGGSQKGHESKPHKSVLTFHHLVLTYSGLGLLT